MLSPLKWMLLRLFDVVAAILLKLKFGLRLEINNEQCLYVCHLLNGLSSL